MRCRRTVDLLGEKRMELTVAGTAADSHRIPVFKDRIHYGLLSPNTANI